MNEAEIEAGFTEALKRWDAHNPKDDTETRCLRYFYFAGASFGTEAAARIYSSALAIKTKEESA